MKSHGKRLLRDRSGTTLAEMVVTLLVSGIIMGMIVGIISPAAKLFLRMQRLQRAQAILDNTVRELQDVVGRATVHVKIYSGVGADGDTTGKPGAGSGTLLEFVSPEGYVTLVSAEGCPRTRIRVGGADVETADAMEAGRLLVRYYARETASEDGVSGVTYHYKENGAEIPYVARGVAKPFGEGYYMGNYLGVEFSYPAGVGEDAQVTYLVAKVRLYGDEARTEVVVQEEVALELRYVAERTDGVTAVEPGAP